MWNNFQFLLYILQAPEMKTLTLAVASFFSQNASNLNAAASALIAIMPIAIIYLDSKLWDIETKLYDFIIINLLWMIFSIPLITLGPATYAGLKCIKELEEGSSHNIFILYLNSFKENFLSYMLGFNTFLGLLIVFGKLSIDMLYSGNLIFTSLCIFIIIECILAIGLIFTIKDKNPIDLILKSIVLGNKNALKVLLTLVLCIGVLVFTMYVPILLPVAMAICMFISYKIVY